MRHRRLGLETRTRRGTLPALRSQAVLAGLALLLAGCAGLAWTLHRLLPEARHAWPRAGLVVLMAGLAWGPAAFWAVRPRGET